jgi:hypothetical protein
MLLISAIVNGPAHALARRWLAGQLEKPLTAYVEPLAEAAWAALRGVPVGAPPAHPAPVSSRITVELLDDDGTVTARTEQRIELVPALTTASAVSNQKEER